MEPVSLIFGLAIGGGAGALVLMFTRKSAAAKSRELESARKELERLRKESSSQLDKVKKAEAESRHQGTAAREKAASLEKAVEERIQELARLKVSLQQIEAARDQALEQANARQAARQQAEGRLRQAEKLASESTQQLSSIASELKRAQDEQSSLADMVRRRGEEIARLRATLESKGAGGAADLESSVEVFADTDGSLKSILEVLVDKEAQQVAVLADGNGIVIAASGEKDLKDGIAAVTQLFAATSSSFEGMIPFGLLTAFAMRDSESMVIAGRAFDAAGERIALATYGCRQPSERSLDGAMASLSAALE